MQVLTEEQPIGIKEACQYLKIHEQTLYKYTRNGKMPRKFIHRVGRSVRFFKSELQEFLKAS